jgi:DNA-binding transcriptional MerR regulator
MGDAATPGAPNRSATLRVEDLARAADVSVDTIRFYQKRRLLPPPTRRGRIAWYGPEHTERLARIRDLQRRGFSLALIRRMLDGELDAADVPLAAAVAAAAASPDDDPAGPSPSTTPLALACRDRFSTHRALVCSCKQHRRRRNHHRRRRACGGPGCSKPASRSPTCHASRVATTPQAARHRQDAVQLSTSTCASPGLDLTDDERPSARRRAPPCSPPSPPSSNHFRRVLLRSQGHLKRKPASRPSCGRERRARMGRGICAPASTAAPTGVPAAPSRAAPTGLPS